MLDIRMSSTSYRDGRQRRRRAASSRRNCRRPLTVADPPHPARCSSLPCYDFMYCTPMLAPLFKEFSKLERLEVL